jgi:XisI protein
MDKLIKYRNIITAVLHNYVAERKVQHEGEMDDELILDPVRDHYILMSVGWDGLDRVYFPIFHLDIRNEKVWVQEDATDFGIVAELENQGVDKKDIVLAFHAPYKRPHTGYATA